MRDDGGAVAVLVALLLPVVLLGFGALVIDGGSLYSERRQLQNGADAGALALAQICSQGSCSTSGATPSQTAGQFADANSKDGASHVRTLCGNAPGLMACPAVPAGVPSGARYVKVTTETGSSGGVGLMPAILGRAIDSTYDGKTVSATAVAAYGPPSSLVSALPVTISLCEWNKFTNNGTTFGTAPYTAAMEKVLYLHDTSGATSCPAGPSGSDLPGGFGWLLTKTSACQAFSDTSGQFPDDPGVSVDKVCKDELAAVLGTTLYLPIYNSLSGTGSNGKYSMAGFAAFVLTGWALPGTSQKSTITGTAYCKGSDKCLYGVFTKPLAPADGVVGPGGGTSYGVNVYQLVG